MKNILFVILFLSLVFFGCADESENSDNPASDTDIESVTSSTAEDSTTDTDTITDSTGDSEITTNDDQIDDEESEVIDEINNTDTDPETDTVATESDDEIPNDEPVIVDYGTIITDDSEESPVYDTTSDDEQPVIYTTPGTTADPEVDTTPDTDFPIITSPEPDDPPITLISKINLSGIGNLIIQPQSAPSSKMYSVIGAVSAGLKTVVNGELVDIEIEGGFGKTPIRGFSIKGGNLLKAAVSFQDASGDITTCLVDQFNNCTEIALNPKKSSKFKNADYFIEKAGKLYYLTEDGILRSRNIISAPSGRMLSISGDITSDLAEGVDQFEIDASGDIMYESFGDVTLRHSDGTEILVDGGYWDGRNTLRLDAVSKKFFIGRQDRGFTFYSDQNYFGNLFFDVNGDPVISHAQPVAWDAKMNKGLNGVYFAVNTNQSPSNCGGHIINQKNIVICSNEIFVLGDSDNDLSEINLNYSLHSIFNLQIVASLTNLYMYSEDEFENPVKLSKEDVFNSESNIVSVNYKINPGGLTVTPDNTLNFCGSRDGTDYIVQITNANTTPIYTETPGECSSIVSLP